MNTFPLKILDVESPFYEGECVSLVIPTSDGQYGIQAGHSNMVVAVVPGEIRYTKPDGETNRAVLNEKDIKILKIERVEVDDKNKLIEGSEKEIKF